MTTFKKNLKRFFMGSCVATALAIGTPVATFAYDYIIDAENPWADLNLVENDTVTIRANASTDADGTTIFIQENANIKIVAENSAIKYTNLRIVGRSVDSSSLSLENITFESPSNSIAIEYSGNGELAVNVSEAQIFGDYAAIHSYPNLKISGSGKFESHSASGGKAIYCEKKLTIESNANISAYASKNAVIAKDGSIDIYGAITCEAVENVSEAISSSNEIVMASYADVSVIARDIGIKTNNLVISGKLNVKAKNGGVAVKTFENVSQNVVKIDNAKNYSINATEAVYKGNAEVLGKIISPIVLNAKGDVPEVPQVPVTTTTPTAVVVETSTDQIDPNYIYLSGGEKILATEFVSGSSEFILYPKTENGVSYVIIPIKALDLISAKEDAYTVEIVSDTDTRILSTDFRNLVPEISAQDPNNASLKLTSTKLTESDSVYSLLAIQLPEAKLATPQRNFKAEVIQNTDGRTIADVPNFQQYVTDLISINGELNGNWTVATYNQGSNKFQYVPSRAISLNGQSYVAVDSDINADFSIIDYTPELLDVKDNFWGAPYIQKSVQNLIVTPLSGNEFNPNSLMSAREFIDSILAAVPEIQEYQLLANMNTDQIYNADFLTREQMACIIYNLLEQTNSLPELATDLNQKFTDASSISSEYSGAVSYVVSAEIMLGTSDTTFSSGDAATRAQGATVLVRTLTNLGIID